jgi:hypothetical protein
LNKEPLYGWTVAPVIQFDRRALSNIRLVSDDSLDEFECRFGIT